MKNRLLGLISCALLGAVVASNSFAQSIELEADETVYNHKKGTSVYKGNVKMVRGDMTLYGDQIEVFSQDGAVERVVATAQPSRFVRQQADNKVVAEALSIEYLLDKNLVKLEGQVKIQDQNKTFFGAQATYDLEKKIFASGKRGKNAKQEGRIKLILQPKQDTKTKNKKKRVNE